MQEPASGLTFPGGFRRSGKIQQLGYLRELSLPDSPTPESRSLGFI